MESLFSTGLQALFYLITLFFVLYTVAAAYHWFSYGSERSVSMITLGVYLIVSAPLFLTMAVVITLI